MHMYRIYEFCIFLLLSFSAFISLTFLIIDFEALALDKCGTHCTKRRNISPSHLQFVILFGWYPFLVFFVVVYIEILTRDGVYKEEEEEDLARLLPFVNCAIAKWAISLCMSAWGNYPSLPSSSSSSLSK